MKEVNNLRITNSIILGLSIVGGLIMTIVGIFFGECVDESYGSCYDYAASPVLIAYGITALLISTLIAQVIYLFAAHVEASHKS
jgi:prolipoprotein diacylglyceryltransferase